ncbi:DUF488 domain-containing protein [Rossellomorea vietnamensis]|uniref:DUF488 domain-containing protein n=1 Tax=Rossellomorea vietnamensis TaxID=218284 RepID=A0A5D4K7D2_9BACI|nr:DUF488 domain-containing protein [Rossellomorea vietnamensis]
MGPGSPIHECIGGSGLFLNDISKRTLLIKRLFNKGDRGAGTKSGSDPQYTNALTCRGSGPCVHRRKKEHVGTGRRAVEGIWNNHSFHNYANSTLTDDFQYALEELREQAIATMLVYLCSEHHPARCHRILISNWLQTNGWDVNHLIPDSKGDPEVITHELGNGEPYRSLKKMGQLFIRI